MADREKTISWMMDRAEASFDEAEEQSRLKKNWSDALAFDAERDELKDRFMRALADAENSRKRLTRSSRSRELRRLKAGA